MAENIRSTLVRPAYPSPDKVNYPDHYWVSVPIATTGSLGIAKFDGDYFTVDGNGKVSLTTSVKDALDGVEQIAHDVADLEDGKLDKVANTTSTVRVYVTVNGVQTTIAASSRCFSDRIVMRDEEGRFEATDGRDPWDVVNKEQLDAVGNVANSAYQKPGTGIPESDLDSGVQASLAAADTAYQKPGTGIPESDLSIEVQAKLNGITPNGLYRHDIELYITKTINDVLHEYSLFVEIINSSNTPYTSLGTDEIRALTCRYGCDYYQYPTDIADGLGIMLCPDSFTMRRKQLPKIGFLCFKEDGSTIYFGDDETYTISDIVSAL